MHFFVDKDRYNWHQLSYFFTFIILGVNTEDVVSPTNFESSEWKDPMGGHPLVGSLPW